MKLRNLYIQVVLLLGSLLYFLYRGISYAVLGSYLPLLVVLGVLLAFTYALFNPEYRLARVVAGWSVMLAIWAGVRILLSLTNLFIKEIPEGHVSGQLGIHGLATSVIFFGCAIYLWRNRH